MADVRMPGHLQIVCGRKRISESVACGFNASVSVDDVLLCDVARLTLTLAADGLIVAEVERLKMEAEGHTQVVEDEKGVTYIERYAVSSLFAEAWLLTDPKAECHCGKDGHPLGSINCPVHGDAALHLKK